MSTATCAVLPEESVECLPSGERLESSEPAVVPVEHSKASNTVTTAGRTVDSGTARQVIGRRTLRPYIPCSWFHPIGIYKKVARLMQRMPPVAGMLFITLTIDRSLYPDPETAFEVSRKRIRKLFARLRKGVYWEGQFYQIKVPYATKLEFHDGVGWPHYHLIFLTRRHVPDALIRHLWGQGLTQVRRIQTRDFHYLLKYVTKDGVIPEWVLNRTKTIRIFQPSHGFLKPDPLQKTKTPQDTVTAPQERPQLTLRERLEKWERTAIEQIGEDYRTHYLRRPYLEILSSLVVAYARKKRYLGKGHVILRGEGDLKRWLTFTNPTNYETDRNLHSRGRCPYHSDPSPAPG